MRSLTHCLLAKVVAVFLITIVFAGTLVTSALSVVGIAATLNDGTIRTAQKQIANSYLYTYSRAIASDYYLGNDLSEIYGQSNFYLMIRDLSDQVLWSNYTGKDDVLTSVTIRESINPRVIVTGNEPDEQANWISDAEYNITLYAKANMIQDDGMAWMLNIIAVSGHGKPYFIALSIIGIILFFALLVFLITSAGHRRDSDQIVLNKSDKIPFDLFSLLLFVFGVLQGEIYNIYGSIRTETTVIIGIFVILDFLLLLWYVLSIASRIKAGTLLRNTLVFMVLKLFWRCVCAIGRGIRSLFIFLPYIWKTILVTAGLSLMILVTAIESSEILLLWLIALIVVVPYVLRATISLQKLHQGAKKIAAGNLDITIDTRYMPGNFKRFAESLNSIQNGLSQAVEERLKSERFKTELITNVSHDIKTPLTSIINYVSLIKQEELPTDKLRDYVAVLDRQSLRLKKMTDDLVEASKASTGNLAVNLSPTDVGVLLTQTAGEYSERLEELGLQLVIQQPDEPAMIMADGRHLWRIFDNLLSNICKYAQPSTRVYLTLEMYKNKVIITFRNVSKSQLNISSEELMERFVQGDSSRNTEGSGLGLSIARSLVELQKGMMNLIIDGDLFKVVLVFARLNT
jgi:signal transduction histidine kinase